VIAAGAERGYFTLDADGVAALTPVARESYFRWASLELAFYAENMQ
jgi:hypothetical protein